MKLQLASTSIYRKEILKQAGFEFSAQGSPFDEDLYKRTHPHLKPNELCLHLAQGKAIALQPLVSPDDLIVGCDQLIAFEDEILGKPGSYEYALMQLRKLSGKTHLLHTAIHMIFKSDEFSKVTTTEITLKTLSDHEIESYLKIDQPFDCAGSYKMEKAGLLLAEKIVGGDPGSIQGLSLIDLSLGLRHFNLSFLNFLSTSQIKES